MKYYLLLLALSLLSLNVNSQCNCTSPVPINSGLIACYPFNGNTNDQSGNGNNGTATDIVSTTDRFGNPNSAYYFNGSTSIITVPPNPILRPANRISIAAWVKPEPKPLSPPTWNFIVVCRRDNFSAPYNSYNLSTHSSSPYSNKWSMFLSSTSNSLDNELIGKYPKTEYAWQHVVATYDGVNMNIYTNGKLDTSRAINIPGFLYSNAGINIGNHNVGPSTGFLGVMDDLRIYNRALSACEVKYLYNNCSSPYTADLITDSIVETCVGKSIQITASSSYNGMTYSWSPASLLNNSTIQNPIATVQQSTYFYLTATNGVCSYRDSLLVKVVQPTISVTRIDTSCAGDSVKLQASGAQSYAWQAHPTLSDTSIATPYAKPTIPTKYKLFATVNGCTVIDSVTIRMISPFTVNATADTSICAGDTLRLQATGASFYAWSPKVFISDTAVYNPKVYPNSISKYYVIGRKGGCNAIDSVTVNINPLPVLNIDDAVLCTPVSGFVPNVLQQANVASVLWNPSTYLNANNVITPTINPTQSIAYGVRAFSANACSVLDSVKITLANGINVFAGVDTALCIGDTIQLMASGAASYTWYPKIAISDTSIVNPKVYPIVTQKYYVTGHAGTCQSTDSIIVVVNSFPSIAIEDTAMCEGASAITARVSSQANISSVLWTPSTYLSNNTVLEPLINPSQTIKYLVKAYSAGGCMAADSVTIQVFGNPQVIASNDTVLCKGDTIQLFATNGLNYSWYPPVAITDSLVAAPKVYPSATQKYYVQSKSGLCQTTDSVLVTVNDVPLLDLEDVLLCEDSMAIVPTVLQQQNISTVKWTPATYLSADDILTPTITALKSINYQVQVTSVGGCTANESIEVLVGNAHASFNFTNNTVLVPVTINTQNYSTPANGSFNWYLNGQFWSNLFEPSTQLVDSGKYLIKLVVTDELGCVDSAWQEIDAKFQQLIFVPNVFTPNGDYVNERFVISVDMNLYKSLTGSVWNRWGQLIAEFDGKKANWWDGKFEGESCADGVYYYMFTTKDLNDLEKSYRGTITILR